MKPIFRRKRIREKSSTIFVISAEGFTDDTARKRAKIVVSVMTGSSERLTGRQSKRLCDALNKAVSSFYSGYDETQESYSVERRS